MTGIAAGAGLALAGLGLAVMAAGAHRQARGELEAARTLGRRGGFAAALGALVVAIASPSLAGAIAPVTAAAIALLGGLSGKPRPAWWAAALALAASVALRSACYTSGPS